MEAEQETCRNCGGETPADARFCPRCGAPLAQPPTVEESESWQGWAVCEITLWRGYTRSEFLAAAVNGAEFGPLPCSSSFRWRDEAPPPPIEPFLSAHAELVETLTANGWAPFGEGSEWYAVRFRRRAGRKARAS